MYAFPFSHSYEREREREVIAATHLDPLFLEVDLESQLFPEEHVRVVGLGEGPFQLLQLLLREDGPVASLSLPAGARPAEQRRRVQPRVLARACRGAEEREREIMVRMDFTFNIILFTVYLYRTQNNVRPKVFLYSMHVFTVKILCSRGFAEMLFMFKRKNIQFSRKFDSSVFTLICSY